MADHGAGGEFYSGQLVGMLELVWGGGWLSPGGPDEVAAVIKGIDFKGRTVLDIGCGVGGVDFLLCETHGALHVTGIDVEDTVLTTARRRAEGRGLTAKCGFVKVWPGPLEEAGFRSIGISSRNHWYRQTAREELNQMQGPLYGTAVERLGKGFVDHNIDIWRKMLVVLDTGEHCPTHLRGQKPV